MANRNLTVLNPAGYQEILRSADTLVIPGDATIAGTLTTSQPIQINGTGLSSFDEIQSGPALFTGDVTIDSDDQDAISIVLGANGNVTLSGLLSAGSLQINGTTVITEILDEDQLTSDSATALATQQSIKAYVDQIDVTFNLAADFGVTDLFETSETLTFAGTANEIVTTVSNNQIAFSQPDDVTIKQDLTVTRDILLTGKLDFTGSGHANAFLDEDSFVSDSATALASQQSIKAYVDAVTKSFLIRGDVGSDDTVTTGEILTIAGTPNQITTTITNNMVTVSLPNDVTINRDLTIERNTQVNNGGTLKFGTTTAVNAILDEDNLQSDSDTSLATQQSIKAYVDNFPEATISAKGYMSANDKAKIDGIETGATADQTDLEIKTAYENNANTNAFTDTLLNKLNGIESGSTGDQTGAEIKALYEAEPSAFTDTQFTKLAGIEDAATADQTGAEIKALYEAEANAFTDAQFTKLAGIEAGATADQTDAEIKTAYENNADTNAFTDAEQTKLGGIEAGSTGDQTGAEIKALYEVEPNAFTDIQFTKLAGIETGATADQTDAEIRAAVDAALDSNVFTDADHTKLDGIETAATADQTGAEIKALYEAEPNAFTDAQFTKLAGIETGATADQTDAEIRAAVDAALDSNVFTDADHTKLDGIEDAATADQTGAEIKALYEGEADTNAFTDAEQTKLAGIETNATADQTDAEIKTAYENNADTNAFTDAEQTKLAGIAAGAEVNVATNLSYTSGTRELASSTGTNVTLPVAVAGGDAGLLEGADKSQLDALATDLAGKADLSGGKLLTSQLPDVAITEFLGTVANETAMLALSGEQGDWAIRTDDSKVYVITGSNPTQASDWTGLSYPVAPDTNLTYTAATRLLESSTGTDVTLPLVVASGNAGLQSGADKAKLDGIEAGATADQTDAEIKTAYENNADTNAFTDAEQTKLAGIETAATADQTGAEIKALYEAESDTNAFTDAEQTKLAGIEASATADQTGAEIKSLYEAEADTNAFTDAEQTKLAGIEAAATADQTGAEIKSLYEAELDTNAFTDAEQTKLAGIAAGAEVNVATDLSYTAGTRELASSTGTNVTLPEVVAAGDSGLMTGAQATKLDGIEAGATADQTGAEIKSLYEAEADTNAFTDAEKTKLSGIATGAQVNTVDTVNGQTGTVSINANLSYDASTRELASSIGTNVTLPLAIDGGTAGLMSGAMLTTLNTLSAASGGTFFAADSGTADEVLLGETVTLAGTANQITTTVSANQVQFALPSNVTITGTMTADTLVGDIDGGEYAT